MDDTKNVKINFMTRKDMDQKSINHLINEQKDREEFDINNYYYDNDKDKIPSLSLPKLCNKSKIKKLNNLKMMQTIIPLIMTLISTQIVMKLNISMILLIMIIIIIDLQINLILRKYLHCQDRDILTKIIQVTMNQITYHINQNIIL